MIYNSRHFFSITDLLPTKFHSANIIQSNHFILVAVVISNF